MHSTRQITQRAAVLLWLLLFVSPFTPAHSAQQDLIINIDGLRTEQSGHLIVTLFNKKGSWPKHDSASLKRTIAIDASLSQVVLPAIETGKRYAVQILHDHNSNGVLDFRWFPYPKPSEGVGVSNNHRRMGPPSFEKALFEHTGSHRPITIEIGY